MQHKQLPAFRSHDLYPGPERCVRKACFTQPVENFYLFIYLFIYFFNLYILIYTGLSLRAGGRGFSPATKRLVPGYFYWKIEEK